MGKYSHITPKLPQHPGVEPERADVVETVKQQIRQGAQGEAPDIASSDPALMLQDALELARAARQIVTYSATGSSSGAYAQIYATARRMRESLDTLGSEMGVVAEAAQILMCDQMDTEGITSLTLSSGQPIHTHKEPWATVEDKETFRRWCITEGLERQMVLPWATVNALSKQRLLAGEPEPPGVKVYAKTVVRLSKGD